MVNRFQGDAIKKPFNMRMEKWKKNIYVFSRIVRNNSVIAQFEILRKLNFKLGLLTLHDGVS